MSRKCLTNGDCRCPLIEVEHNAPTVYRAWALTHEGLTLFDVC
jgi:hypothetical protein